MEFLASLISPIVNFVSGLFTNSSNKKQTEATNAANMAMNQANIDFQREENEITRQREDTAVQRRASDLVAAGLSKTLAAGSPASANALNAPNNSFAMQPHRNESPKFDFDYGQVRQNLSAANYNNAAATAAEDNARANLISAKAAERDAKTKERQQKIELYKFAKEHGLNLAKFGLDESKFDWQKEMESKEFDLKYYIQNESLSLDQKKYKLSVDELELKQKELNNKILDSISERAYRTWQETYQKYSLELDRNADKREAEIQKYNITLIEARVQEYLSSVRLNEEQIRFVKKNSSKIVAEMLKMYSEDQSIKADTLLTLQKAITEIYNRGVAENEGTNTSSHIPGSTELHENALDRALESKVSGTNSMRQFFSIVLFCLLGGKGPIKF